MLAVLESDAVHSTSGAAAPDDLSAAEAHSVTSTTEQQPPTRELTIGRLAVNRVLFLGNSITLHGPLESIGWTGNWGMAASTPEKDYVHLLTKHLEEAAGGRPEIMIQNIADFERDPSGWNIEDSLAEELAFNAHLIVLAIGENVSELKTEADRDVWRLAVQRLITKLQSNSEKHGRPDRPVILVRSCFWSNAAKDHALQAACEATGAVYVCQDTLGADESNYARAERKIEHAGVAAHPGDKGMQAIADGLWDAVRTQSSVASATVPIK